MTAVDPQATSSDLVGRVKRILLSPSTEWDRIDGEAATIKSLYVGYVCILAAIPPLAGLIGGQVFGIGALGFSFKPSITGAVITAVIAYGLSLLSVFLIALIIDALATTFDGQKNQVQAFKVAAYSYTAAWVAGVLGLVPMLGLIGGLVSLYSLYLLYLGLPKLMKVPQEKAVGYTVVTVLCAIVLSIVIGVIASAIGGAALFGAANHITSGGRASGTVEVNGTKVDLGKIEAASKQLEAANKAAAEGKALPVVSADVLKNLLPASVAGYQRADLETNSGGAGGVSMSAASARYAKDGGDFNLQITDMGGIAGIAALTSAIDAQSSHETATGYEKMGKVDGRMTTEEWDREAKSGKYSTIVGGRFTVEARGNADNVDVLKQAVTAVNFGQLEGLAR